MPARWSLLVGAWLLSAGLLPSLVKAACDPDTGLTLLHFNDLHGQLEPYLDGPESIERGGLARLAGTVERIRAEAKPRPVLLLFGGDLLQGTLTSSLFQGIPDVKLLGRMGVDAAVMGNHELDYGQDALRRLAQVATFPFLSANVASDPVPLPVQPWARITRSGGLEVAVLGLTTPELTTAVHPRNAEGISVEEPVTVAQRLAPELRAGADLVVVLSHLGIQDDRRLARAVPGIDLIVGGHNHDRYEQPVIEGSVPILQAGERGGWLGRMDFECRDGRLSWDRYALIPIGVGSPEDPAIASEVQRLVAEADLQMSQQVGVSARELSAERELIRRGEAPLGNLVADLAREITQADVALFNGGGFRASLPAGPVTLKAIAMAFPFRNELVVGELTGAELLAALGRSASLDPLANPGGFLQVSGVRYVIAGGQLADATVKGMPVDPTDSYQVVTSDFLAAGGDGYRMLESLRDPVMTGRLISDMVIEAFRVASPVDASLDGRIERR